jgi:hypothetical protein
VAEKVLVTLPRPERKTLMKKVAPMTQSNTTLARLATGLSGLTVGAYCAFTAYQNGQSLGSGPDAVAFGSAFAAVVIGSWFLLPIAAQAKADGHRARSFSIKAGWVLCLTFVLINAVGSTSVHRGNKVPDNSTAIAAYDSAVAKDEQLRTELAAMKANQRWQGTSGCTDATAEKSRDFCAEVKRAQLGLDRAETSIKTGRPGAADAVHVRRNAAAASQGRDDRYHAV